MDRRPCMCLPFGRIKAGGNEAGRGGSSRGGTKWVRSGSVCSTEVHQVRVYLAFCHLPWGPFCRPSQMFDIIDGVWGVEGLLGRMRLKGERGVDTAAC